MILPQKKARKIACMNLNVLIALDSVSSVVLRTS